MCGYRRDPGAGYRHTGADLDPLRVDRREHERRIAVRPDHLRIGHPCAVIAEFFGVADYVPFAHVRVKANSELHRIPSLFRPRTARDAAQSLAIPHLYFRLPLYSNPMDSPRGSAGPVVFAPAPRENQISAVVASPIVQAASDGIFSGHNRQSGNRRLSLGRSTSASDSYRDGAFGSAYLRRVRAMGIRDHPT